MIRQKESGQLIVISGPSGSGKGTIISKLLERNSNLYLSISTTSRPIRKNDIDGVTYNFVSEEEFLSMIDEKCFLEFAKYSGNYYGTPRKKIKENLNNGVDVILEIEIEGAKKIKELIPEAIFIFIMPPSLKELVKRLKMRKTDTKQKIVERFITAYKEINEVSKYNYVVVNDKVDEATSKIEAILKAEKCRVDRIEDVYLDTKEEEIHELLLENDFKNEGIMNTLE